MGKRGPAPKPTALKILEGNPGKRKIRNTGEPMPPQLDTAPSPPRRLLPEAKQEWKRLAPMLTALGLLTTADTAAFAELCQNYAYYLAADAKILSDGPDGMTKFQVAPSGYTQAHPLLTIRRQYYELWHKGLSDFGLTPAARARLAADTAQQAKTKDADPMESILAGRW